MSGWGRRMPDARVPSKSREDLSGPDFIAQQLGDIIRYNTYILPESTNWAGDLERDPCLALAASLALARAGNFQILLKGDLNARTSSNTPSANDPPRTSKDDKPRSPRSRFLFRLCNDYDLVFISGADCFGPASGEYTSFQGSRTTVIDYAICSRSLFSKIRSFKVEPQVKGFDHAALVLQLEVDSKWLSADAFVRPKKRKREEVELPSETELDKILIETLAAGKDTAKKSLNLFGSVLAITTPIAVTICG
ncbi:hypothetical protein B0H16DRAFT_1725013 [Mycena metata]|uniref:Endonuclease/exonuclease/phosphatase domain-containing protein n=1 Tax=Mycena metata TaxID=1033252 RepID=A0AAD7N881_9AGAR|nr:hypothetical protein B0H16DRAFT_1725013 [Mycena metata]